MKTTNLPQFNFEWGDEIKRRLIPGKIIVTVLDRVLKCIDITLTTKECIVK